MKKIPLVILILIILILVASAGFLYFKNSSQIDFTRNENTDLNSTSTDQIKENDPEELTILFVGDMMFDRAIRKKINRTGYDSVFGDSKKIFEGADLVIGNLEGPITTYPSKTLLPDGSQTKLLSFTFPTSTASALKNFGFDMVSLANNHTDNFGQEGVRQTKKYLKDFNIQYFGEPTNSGEISTTTCRNDICIGFVGYHEFTYQNEGKILNEVKRLDPLVDYVIVMPHWGDEYNRSFAKRQQNLAHQWIDAGADLIIGAHPHVIEPVETYKGKKIFYSLGNYIFDQYFSFDTTHGITAKITLPKDRTKEVGATIIPISNVGIEVKIPDPMTNQRILDEIKYLP
jgi:gamma-polyglutamate biosynthesis protein CapA